ncbi:hypothetical protein [Pseudonocardia alni]|uniref:Uncharacterized protein n=1 Tax=Pseudonocardia alni TaxID=33907 RepID=A0A852VTY8_PSEA5|nr:hypothetical protein [Pseudonocardia antarctica]NYG00353.1 hypothetical protein [Pseudonocardia antarctica]
MTDVPAAPQTDAPPSATDIAERAQQWKVLFLSQQLSLMAMMLPGLPVLTAALDMAGTPRDGDFPMDLMHGTDEPGPERERYSFSAREVATVASKIRGPILNDLMAMPMLAAAVRVHDMIRLSGLDDPDVPLLQFARHYRNATAHGDRWHFTGDQPKRPARCRDLTLTADLHGQRASFHTISPRLHVEFLDDIANHFVPGLVPEPPRS